jgi:outer membrane protein assembly factor BamB
VDVLVAGKTMQVFDKANKKLWQSGLAAPIGNWTPYQRDPFAEEEEALPAVENGDRLYFFDPSMLTCFHLATGNALWRFHAGGISHLEFDSKGVIYVTATRGGVEHLRDGNQLDPERKGHPVILKLDPANGTPLWDLPRRVQSCRPSGKFVYGMDASKGDSGTVTRRPTPEYMRLYRLENDTGLERWQYYEKRMPLSWDCQDNTIVFLFGNELQMLKFLSL